MCIRMHSSGGRMRSKIFIRVKGCRTCRSVPDFTRTLDPSVRFAAAEWIDTQRKEWRHTFKRKAAASSRDGEDADAPSGGGGAGGGRRPNQTACTPMCVYKFLQDAWALRLSQFDPCPASHLTESGPCGLTVNWEAGPDETVYCNPPFNNCKPWLEKALREMRSGRVKSVVMMLPARVCPAWFHESLLPHAARIVAARGSITFENPDGTPFSKAYPWGVFLCLLQAPRVVAHARLESHRFV